MITICRLSPARLSAWFLVLLLCTTPGLAADLEKVTQQLNHSTLPALRLAYADLAGEQDTDTSRDRAILLYHIAEKSADYDTLLKALEQLETLQQQHPHDAELTAYLGSAYTLRARDFPWGGLYQILPGPGFMRLAYTNKGINLLDQAVELDPGHPVVRLIRGVTYTHMPRIFGQFHAGLKDLKLLDSWLDDPDTHNAYAALLHDPAFQAEARFRLAEAYWIDDKHDTALALFSLVAKSTPANTPVGAAAREMTR